MTSPPPDLVSLGDKWLSRPDLWARDVFLGDVPTPQGDAILRAVAEHRKVAVAACHASSKTWTAARAVLWFLYTFPDSIVLTTAPTFRQVEGILWSDLARAFGRFRWPQRGSLTKTPGLEISKGWYALGFKSEDASEDKFQGFHAPSGNAMVVLDEAAGISETVERAIRPALAAKNSRLLVIGNPTSSSGFFHAAFHENRALWKTIRIDAFETANFSGIVSDEDLASRSLEDLRRLVVAPYLITPEWAREVGEEYGWESAYYRSRVRAQFPQQGDDSLISLSWLEAADRLDREGIDRGDVFAGVDVARFGGDETVVVLRRGGKVIGEWGWKGADLMATCGRIVSLLGDLRAERKLKGVAVDTIGMGGGVYDRLRELRWPVVSWDVSRAPKDPDRFRSLRDEAAWGLRTVLRLGAIAGPFSEAFKSQAASIKFGYDSSGRIVVESKEAMKKRGLRSPDRFDAYVAAFAPWVRLTPENLLPDLTTEAPSVDSTLESLDTKEFDDEEEPSDLPPYLRRFLARRKRR